MRTTVTIHDDLYRELKQRAAQTGRSVGALIEDAVREKLLRGEQPADRLDPLCPYGGSGLVPGVDISSNAAVRDAMDADEPLDALR